MKQQYNHIGDLIIRSITGKLSEEEQKKMDAWINETPENSQLFKQMNDEKELGKMLRTYNSITNYDLETGRKIIEQKLNIQMPVIKINPQAVIWWKRPITIVSAAAAVLLVVTLMLWQYIKKAPEKEIVQRPFENSNNYRIDNLLKAKLTLADGSTIDLDGSQKGVLTQQDNTIIKAQDKQLIYQAGEPKQTQQILYNRLETPAGGQIHIVLPDGSNVWLNASSSIHYPTAFTGKERKVNITGEAYFEVSKNPQQPFRVMIQNKTIDDATEIEVLGTHFNINDYREDPVIRTTLLEGSVKVKNRDSSWILQPNQQAQIMNTDSIKMHRTSLFRIVYYADIEKTMAWRKGMFVFKNDDINTISKEIKRWYNADVEVKGKIEETFTGRIRRSKGLDKFLSDLFQGTDIGYKINGNKVYIKPQSK
jgi:transmembrane sensor